MEALASPSLRPAEGDVCVADYYSQDDDDGLDDDSEFERTMLGPDQTLLVRDLVEMGFSAAAADSAVRLHDNKRECVDWLSQPDAAAATSEAADHFDCAICMSDGSVCDGVQLACDEEHWFCNDCLRAHLEILIVEKRVADSDMTCPASCESGCIDAVVVRQLVDPATYQRYLDARLEVEWARRHPDEVAKCPRCEWMGFVECARDKAGQVFCPQCRTSFCGLCRAPPHRGKSCSEAAAAGSMNMELLRIMAQHGLQQCPGCREAAVRSGGCKYLRCRCGVCFCLHCGRQLNEEQHYTHFRDGPFGKKCFGGAVDKAGHQAEPACGGCTGWSTGRTDCRCRAWQGAPLDAPPIAGVFPGDPRGMPVEERQRMARRYRQLQARLQQKHKEVKARTGRRPTNGDFDEEEGARQEYVRMRDLVRMQSAPIVLTPDVCAALTPEQKVGLESEMRFIRRRYAQLKQEPDTRHPALLQKLARRYRAVDRSLELAAAGSSREPLYPGDPRALPMDYIAGLQAEMWKLRRKASAPSTAEAERVRRLRRLLRTLRAPRQLPTTAVGAKKLSRSVVVFLRNEAQYLERVLRRPLSEEDRDRALQRSSAVRNVLQLRDDAPPSEGAPRIPYLKNRPVTTCVSR
eukprot:TRINITY_DN8268_c0_g1_i1.p1 TRINITY_DN8268_c0_g1~~TRINITY_DN8268_c0_g1_i1.p1  ORF type:complete len:632 (+),score=93.62 TRINITY_DN8268_c0_g1_i1:53-1948(+)